MLKILKISGAKLCKIIATVFKIVERHINKIRNILACKVPWIKYLQLNSTIIFIILIMEPQL